VCPDGLSAGTGRTARIKTRALADISLYLRQGFVAVGEIQAGSSPTVVNRHRFGLLVGTAGREIDIAELVQSGTLCLFYAAFAIALPPRRVFTSSREQAVSARRIR